MMPGRLGRMLVLDAGDAVVEVSPALGGRVAALAVAGTDLVVRRSPDADALSWGCFPMVPWAGRIGDARFDFAGYTVELEANFGPHAIHGTAFDTPWDVLDEGRDHCELGCALRWELGGRAHQHLQLLPAALVCVLSVVAGDRSMPATIGWHPWFVKPDRDQLLFEAMYERGADHLPTGRLVAPTPRPWDDCLVRPVRPLQLEIGGLTVTVASDADHWVVYDEPDDATCVEPQSGPPDAFRLGAATVLRPGEMLQRTMTISW